MAVTTQITSALLNEPFVGNDQRMTYRWYTYFRGQGQLIDQGPTRIGSPIALANQSTSIGTTSITSETLTAGLYRVTYYLRVTTPDGVTSSIRLNLAWDDTGVSCTHNFTALTNDTVTLPASESFMLNLSQPPLSYSTTYASNTPAKMRYSLEIVLESVAL